jgi:hypothetical protein
MQRALFSVSAQSRADALRPFLRLGNKNMHKASRAVLTLSSQLTSNIILNQTKKTIPNISTMPLSQHPIVPLAATLFGTIFVGFGFNYIFNSRQAFISSFDFPYPAAAEEQRIIDSFCVLFGAKDLFMGVAIYSAAWLGTRKSLGVILLAASVCAGIDGVVVNKAVGHGEWNHWGYGSLVGVLGVVSLGLLG